MRGNSGLPPNISPLPSLLAPARPPPRGHEKQTKHHDHLVTGCLAGRCLKAINGDRRFCPVSALGLRGERRPEEARRCEPGRRCPLQFPHVTVTHAVDSPSPLRVGGGVRPTPGLRSLAPARRFSSGLSDVQCEAKVCRNVEGLERRLGTWEEAPRSSRGDNGGWRPAGLYFVHTIHFTRIQAAREWRISTSVRLLETSDSKPAGGLTR